MHACMHVPVSESYSLRQDGNIVRYRLRRRAAGATPNENYLEQKNEWYEDKWIVVL